MPAPSPAPTIAPARRGWNVRIAILILVIAAGWRVALSAASPCLSRDGALYCWQARDLGLRGFDVIRGNAYDQHPLYSATILAAQRVLRAGAAPDSPETWELAGRIVAGIAGMAVVALCGLLTWRLAAAVAHGSGATGGLPASAMAARAGQIAMALAALLPLNAWLSADVMSDQLHAAFYLAAVCCLVNLRPLLASAVCGALAALAFLTRPEGAVVAAAAGATVLASMRSFGLRAAAVRLALLIVSFAAIAGPYVVLSGRLSSKLDKESLEQFQPQPAASADFHAGRVPERAALVRRDLDWYALAPAALYELGRAGRVVVPLLALPALYALRRRWRTPSLLGIASCAAIHFALCMYLLQRHGYLDPRHLLPAVLLLIPFAAGTLAWAISARTHAQRITAWLVIIATLATLGYYARRVPNDADRPIREHASWLRTNDPDAKERKLVAGSSGRRIAFYADMRWQPWAENEPDAEKRYADLIGHVVFGRADYFAIEAGPGQELAGNAELLERLRNDPAIADHRGPVHRITARDGLTSHLWAFDWSER